MGAIFTRSNGFRGGQRSLLCFSCAFQRLAGHSRRALDRSSAAERGGRACHFREATIAKASAATLGHSKTAIHPGTTHRSPGENEMKRNNNTKQNSPRCRMDRTPPSSWQRRRSGKALAPTAHGSNAAGSERRSSERRPRRTKSGADRVKTGKKKSYRMR